MTRQPDFYPAAVSDRLLYCQRRMANGWSSFVVELNGKVRADVLRAAARHLVDVFPLLGCRYVDHWFRPYWERRVDIDDVTWLTESSDSNLDRAINEFVNRRRDPCVDPVYGVRLIRGETDVLVLDVCNMLTDGGGAMMILEALSAAYSGLLSDSGFHLPPVDVGDRGYRTVLSRLPAKDRRVLWRNLPRFVRRAMSFGPWSFPFPVGKPESCFHLTHTIDESTCQQLARVGRSWRATVNVLLITAIYRALRAEFPAEHDKPLPIMMPISLRTYFPDATENVLAHFVGGSLLLGEGKADEPFEETLERFLIQMKESSRRYLGMVSPGLTIEGLWPARLVFQSLPYALVKRMTGMRMRRMARPPGPGMVVMTSMEASTGNIRFGEAVATGILAAGNLPRIPGVAPFALTRLGDRVRVSTGGFESCFDSERLARVLKRFGREVDQIVHDDRPSSLADAAIPVHSSN
ncbi:MAG: hypothetical protein KF777_02500 [Planctomycetaceae bacterium]|nr:hypothetical protein [Planctomycetaceae bacterium]